jgi:putative membrane protein
MDIPLPAYHFWYTWTFEPGVIASVLLATAWYLRGVHRLGRRAIHCRAIGQWQRAAAAAGMLTVVVALVSPLDAIAAALFSAHMVQHLLLVLVAAPLFVLSDPMLPALHALPDAWRTRLRTWLRPGSAIPTIARGFSAPAVAWVLHVGTLFFWHIPASYEWAIRNDAVHAAEHVSLLATGVLFWWVALRPTGRRRLGYGMGVLYVCSAGVVMGVFGAILTFAPSPWYTSHLLTTAAWHLTPLEDQQLAGVIMWAPASLAYLAAASLLMVQWIGRDSTNTDRSTRTANHTTSNRADDSAPRRIARRRSKNSQRVRLVSTTALLAGGGLLSVSACHGESEPLQSVVGGDAARGKQKIETYGCGSCHVVPGIRTARGAVGPPLTAFGRRSFIAGELPNTSDSLIRWIENPQSVEPGTAMPNLGVGDRDARDIAAYLYTLR